MTARRTSNDKLTCRRRASLSLPERADIAATEGLAPVLRSRVGQALGQLGNLADEPPLLALSVGVGLAGVVLGKPRLVRTGARMVSAHLISTGLKEIGKDHIDRTRPGALLDKRRYRMSWGRSRRAALRAFPSGHTAGAIALAAAASREYPVQRPAFAAAATMGALQVMRLAHFPGDVLAGALLGFFSEGMSHRIMRAAARRAA